MIYLITNPFTDIFKSALLVLNGLVHTYLPLPAYISSYAVAIIGIAVLVKLITFPLTAAQTKSMRAMQTLQPKMADLQARFKDDREKLAAAQMALYKEHSVNPFGGCLPLIVQMFVLFGLYQSIRALQVAGALDGQRFFWIPDLALCEPSPMCHPELAVLPLAIPILLVAMTLSQFAYQKLMTPPTTSTDPTQQAMAQSMMFMPLIFAWIFVKFPSGLVLYYTVFNLLTFVQQAVLNRTLGGPGSPVVASDSPGPLLASSSAVLEEQTTYDSTQPRRRKRKKGN